jgi:xylulokinase
VQPPLWLGVDVGTSATRVVVVADDGTVVAGASAGYETKRAAGGVAEQEPAHWLGALEQALALAGVASLVPAAMGLCGQTPTLVLTGSDGEAVRPALTWQDTRARDEAIELAERFGDPAPLVGTALPWSAANMPAKLLWLARHEPAAVRQTRWLLQPKDFVAMALTGSPLSDPWCSKGLCRVDDGAPVSELLEACGWPSSSCPPLGAPWQQRGTVSAAAARSFGLPAGLPVSIGWSDALVQILAAGSFERQSAFVFSGTSSIVGTPVAGTAAGARAGGLFHVPRFCAPSPLLYGPTQSSGASIAWAARLLGVQPEELPALAAAARGESPVFVPYLSALCSSGSPTSTVRQSSPPRC